MLEFTPLIRCNGKPNASQRRRLKAMPGRERRKSAHWWHMHTPRHASSSLSAGLIGKRPQRLCPHLCLHLLRPQLWSLLWPRGSRQPELK
jgi:hypothetical protein